MAPPDSAAPMRVSDVEYARVGDDSVAYRTIDSNTGRVDHDIVMMLTGALSMDSLLEEPTGRRFVEALANAARVTLFDRRGVGLSDPVLNGAQSMRAAWADDLAAVVEACTLRRPSVVAFNLSDPVVLYAATHPDALNRIVIYEPNITSLRDNNVRAETTRMLQANVAGELDLLSVMCPTRADDAQFRAWFERAGRAGAAPGGARRLYESLREDEATTFRDAYEQMDTPVLVLRRPTLSLFSDTQLRSAFPRAEIIELPGRDWYFLGERLDAMLAEVTRFVTGTPSAGVPTCRVAALLFTDLVASTTRVSSVGDDQWTAVIAHHDFTTSAVIERHGGRVVKTTGDGLLAELPSTAAALRAAVEIREVVEAQGLEVRIGVHVGDIHSRDDDIFGVNVHFAARVLAAATAGEILVSQAAALTALGTSGSLSSRGGHELKGFDGIHPLFAYEAPASTPRLDEST